MQTHNFDPKEKNLDENGDLNSEKLQEEKSNEELLEPDPLHTNEYPDDDIEDEDYSDGYDEDEDEDEDDDEDDEDDDYDFPF